MKKQGFTLIELMIILVVIGILAAVALPRFTSIIDEGRRNSTEQEMASIKSQCQVYLMHMREMPVITKDLIVSPIGKRTRADGSAWIQTIEKWGGMSGSPYMEGDESEVCYDAWGHPYVVYYRQTPPYGFLLFSYGSDGLYDPTSATPDDLQVWLRYDGEKNLAPAGYLYTPPATIPATCDEAGPAAS
ncbi:MAG: type II secretion system protein [Candidatus Wallbacteria bacterium]|nr:type II secretion system protein [Candidatus Wallbacteria bacterium]